MPQEPDAKAGTVLDVLVVGAGLSGIGIGAHLLAQRPGLSLQVLEARAESGGTWSLFRYPGIRSDSAIRTYAYRDWPWSTGNVLASGPQILAYLRAVARRSGVAERVACNWRVERADWDPVTALWRVDARGTGPRSGSRATIRARWLVAACGYFDYAAGHTPDLPGTPAFSGQVVHPQDWPEGLEVAGRRVIVIGSGATAVTMVPALADQGAQVVMLQRSPGYILPVPARDRLGSLLEGVLGASRGYRAARSLALWQQEFSYAISRRHPDLVRWFLRTLAARMLPPGYPVDPDFTPAYPPWDQRLCVSPDADLYRAITRGQVQVVTGEIAEVLPEGIRMEDGQVVAGDIIVTATGLRVLPFGGLTLVVDGEPVAPSQRLAYRGAMLSGVPNFMFALGYTHAAWTLKVDLVAQFLSRVLAEMDRLDAYVATPVPPPGPIATRPLLDLDAGYLRRARHLLPRAGAQPPWDLPQDYRADVRRLLREPLADGVLRFDGLLEARSAESDGSGRSTALDPSAGGWVGRY